MFTKFVFCFFGLQLRLNVDLRENADALSHQQRIHCFTCFFNHSLNFMSLMNRLWISSYLIMVVLLIMLYERVALWCKFDKCHRKVKRRNLGQLDPGNQYCQVVLYCIDSILVLFDQSSPGCFFSLLCQFPVYVLCHQIHGHMCASSSALPICGRVITSWTDTTLMAIIE